MGGCGLRSAEATLDVARVAAHMQVAPEVLRNLMDQEWTQQEVEDHMPLENAMYSTAALARQGFHIDAIANITTLEPLARCSSHRSTQRPESAREPSGAERSRTQCSPNCSGTQHHVTQRVYTHVVPRKGVYTSMQLQRTAGTS